VVTNWSWDFDGDGAEDSRERSPAWEYATAGVYRVSLSVAGPGGSDATNWEACVAVAASGYTVYVDGAAGNDASNGLTRASAVRTIQRGLDLAAGGWRVLVAPGTYAGPGTRNLDYGGKSVHLRGEGPRETVVVDAGGEGRGFWFHTGESRAAVLEGLTVRNGAVAPGIDVTGGGGIRVDADATIRDCVVRGNTVLGYAYVGAGILATCSPLIEGCLIEDNHVSWDGGGLALYGFGGEVRGCVIRGNGLGGRYGAGVFCAAGGSPRLVNCLIAGNAGVADGGGLYSWQTPVELVNCTVALNEANRYGGGVYASAGASVALRNCVVWTNWSGSAGQQVYAAGAVSADRCDVEEGDSWDLYGALARTACLNQYPVFFDLASGGLQLAAGSPCVDAGDNAWAPPGPDLAGLARVRDGDGDGTATVDMGAYEHPGSLPPGPAWGAWPEDGAPAAPIDACLSWNAGTGRTFTRCASGRRRRRCRTPRRVRRSTAGGSRRAGGTRRATWRGTWTITGGSTRSTRRGRRRGRCGASGRCCRTRPMRRSRRSRARAWRR
jgi:PKD repeat protein